MTTYTIAYKGTMLLALVPDGEDIDVAVQKEVGEPIADYKTEEGLILTNVEPDDRRRIVWNATNGRGGWLSAGDTIYNYAIR